VRRVAVVGSSGSGKTTLGTALAARLGVAFVELDGLHHLPGWQERATDEFRAAVADALTADGWVVDGNYQSKLGRCVVDAADTIVWIDLPRRTAMRRVIRRTLRRVVTREELWNGNREPWSNLWSRDPLKSIIAWTWTHHGPTRRRYEEQADAKWVRLRTPRDVRQFLASVPRGSRAAR
jgi:adenylate kinase family enzyme